MSKKKKIVTENKTTDDEFVVEETVLDDTTPNDTVQDALSEDTQDIVENSKPRKVMSWGGGIALAALASCLGAAGGWGLSQFKGTSSQIGLAPTIERLEALEAESASQKTQLSQLQAELGDYKRAMATHPVDLQPLEDRIVGLEQHILKLDNTKIKATASGLKEKTAEPTDDMAQITDTLDVIEESKEDSIADVYEPKSKMVMDEIFEERFNDLTSDITAFEIRLDTLESELETTKGIAATPVIVKEAVLLPPFPRDEIFEAMTRVDAAKDAGWMSRALNKHITVRDPADVEMANNRLDDITVLIAKNDIESALVKVLKLPPEGLEIAKPWIAAAKRQSE